jgi:hypothetical protein
MMMAAAAAGMNPALMMGGGMQHFMQPQNPYMQNPGMMNMQSMMQPQIGPFDLPIRFNFPQ